jgi:ABC-type amino acid transport substrate-binding protein
VALALALTYPPRVTNTKFGKILIFFVALFALAACNKTQTTISQSYRNPGYEQTVFKKLLVIGVAANQENRQAFENAFAKAIANEGGAAQASWGVLPQDEQLTEEELRAAVEAGKFDGVLITRLLAVDKEEEYTPGSTYLNPRTQYYSGGGGLYGYGFYGFYGTTYAQVREPGYFDTSTTIRVETNLYSAANDGLVWTGQSETVDPDSIPDARESMTAAVAKKLKEEKLIP